MTKGNENWVSLILSAPERTQVPKVVLLEPASVLETGQLRLGCRGEVTTTSWTARKSLHVCASQKFRGINKRKREIEARKRRRAEVMQREVRVTGWPRWLRAIALGQGGTAANRTSRYCERATQPAGTVSSATRVEQCEGTLLATYDSPSADLHTFLH